MAELNKENTQSGIDNVGSALTRVEQFFEDNQKIITIVGIVIVVVVGAIFAYKKLYLAPLETEAHKQMFVAEQYFEKDSFNLALKGDGNNWGFLKIIDEYGSTKAANLCEYYAGISCLHLGKFQEAVDHLEEFKSDDIMIQAFAYGAAGDAYMELRNKEKALKSYLKAVKASDNEFSTPLYMMKAASASELVGDYDQALDLYKQIQEKYPNTEEGRQIEKYITRAEQFGGK